MALIKCPNCNGTVSTKASACPHCGAAATSQLTEAEHLQKLANELGSMSEAITALENGVEVPASTYPSASRQDTALSPMRDEKKLTVADVLVRALMITLAAVLVIAYIYLKLEPWLFPTPPLNVPKGELGFDSLQFDHDAATLQDLQAKEELRKKLNSDLQELIKLPQSNAQQPQADSSK